MRNQNLEIVKISANPNQVEKVLLIVGDVTYTNGEEDTRETIITRVDSIKLVDMGKELKESIKNVNLTKQNYVVIDFDTYYLKSIKNF